MPKLKQVQIQVSQHSEEYWRRKLEELGVKFDEVVMEILKEDFKRRSNPYEPIINAISQYIYDTASKLFGLVDLLNNNLNDVTVLCVLARLEDIASDISSFANSIRKMLPKARE